MPKVKYSNKSGLHSVSGNGVQINGNTDILAATNMNGATMVGQRDRVVVLTNSDYNVASANYELSGSDSGTTFVLGDVASAKTIKMPTVADHGTGWNAKFMLTGSMQTTHSIVLSGRDGVSRWVGGVYEVDDTRTSQAITISATGGVTFNAAGGSHPMAAGDHIEVVVCGDSVSGYVVKGVATN